MAIETKMDDCEIRNRLDFLGSTESDAGPHWSSKPSAGTPILEFIKDFYDHLFRGSTSAPIIRANSATQDGLGRAQAGSAAHLDGCHGTGYVNRRGAIGPPHARIKIIPK